MELRATQSLLLKYSRSTILGLSKSTPISPQVFCGLLETFVESAKSAIFELISWNHGTLWENFTAFQPLYCFQFHWVAICWTLECHQICQSLWTYDACFPRHGSRLLCYQACIRPSYLFSHLEYPFTHLYSEIFVGIVYPFLWQQFEFFYRCYRLQESEREFRLVVNTSSYFASFFILT